jgi:type III secretion protein R
MRTGWFSLFGRTQAANTHVEKRMDILNHPIDIVVILLISALFPVLVVMGSSFLKLSIVLMMTRNALGLQQVPPNIAIYSLALILSAFIMAPVFFQISDNLTQNPISIDDTNAVQEINGEIIAPYEAFLLKQTTQSELKFFSQQAQKMWPKEYQNRVDENSLAIVLPAFAVGQIVSAFKISLLIYLPFIAIDLIVSNVLLALGMMMVSPVTISLPLKLLLFVLISGWEQLLGQLTASYIR